MALASGEFHGVYPVVLGYGEASSWAYGLSKLANKLRSYIFNRTDPEDIVMFFDAFDIIFLGSADDIVNRYLDMEQRYHRKLFYNADPVCTNPCEHEEELASKLQSRWAYLNSGIYIGRSSVFRDLYKDPIPDPLVDKHGQPKRWQYFHVEYYVDHPDTVGVDSGCELTQVVYNVDSLYVNSKYSKSPGGQGLEISGGKLQNTITGTFPLIAHFAGPGHYPNWQDPIRRGSCPAYEVMRALGHPGLVDLWEKQFKEAKGFRLRPWRSMCSHAKSGWDKFGLQMSHFEDRMSYMFGLPPDPIVFFPGLVAALSLALFLCKRSRVWEVCARRMTGWLNRERGH